MSKSRLESLRDAARQPGREPLVTRFAPSPTGYLHIGHLASALYVWGVGKALGARILLRIEDHDDTRCRPEYEAAIFDDLAWLGFHFDNDPLSWRSKPSTYRQSDNDTVYAETVRKLSETQKVFACDCSRKKLLEAQTVGFGERDELHYAGFCRERGIEVGTAETGTRIVLGPEAVEFDDLYLGKQVQVPAQQCGDLLLRDRHGCYTYQFAVTVDDLRHGVNLVVRGQDLTASTGRQIMLRAHLGGGALPHYYHHPLICDESGRKLSKRFFAEAVAKRRAAGARREDLLGEAATLVGLIGAQRAVELDEAAELVWAKAAAAQ